MRRIAASRLAAELLVDPSRCFMGGHSSTDECKCPLANRASIEGSLTPPGHVAAQDVGWVEAIAFEKAFGKAHRHADWSADPVPSRQPDQNALATILYVGHRFLFIQYVAIVSLR